MIFAAFDYAHYRRQTGRYTPNIGINIMAAGYIGAEFAEALPKINPGDLLVIETFDSFLAWLVLYFTSSHMSHLALYAGDEMIAHATTAGVRLDPVSVLYNAKNRIVAFSIPPAKIIKPFTPEIFKDLIGQPYGWRAVVFKGRRILSGRDWNSFKWKFFADFALIYALTDVTILGLERRYMPIGSTFALCYLLTIVACYVRFRVSGEGLDKLDFTPARAFEYFAFETDWPMTVDDKKIEAYRKRLIELALKQGLISEEDATVMQSPSHRERKLHRISVD
jgi:hypothetical protein